VKVGFAIIPALALASCAGFPGADGENSQAYYVCRAADESGVEACRQVPKQVYMREKFGDDRAKRSQCGLRELLIAPEDGSKVPRDRC